MEPSSLTWRERIVAARERGQFTGDDDRAYVDRRTCLAGEVAQRYGVDPGDRAIRFQPADPRWCPLGAGVYESAWRWSSLWVLGDRASEYMGRRVSPESVFLPDAMESLLDQIEDEALRLKREGAG